MIKALKRSLSLIAVLCMLIPSFAACNTPEIEDESQSELSTEEKLVDFDYSSADISNYITVSSADYLNNTVTLSTDYLVSDKMVDEYIADELFKHKTNDDSKSVDKPIKKGDTAYIYYTGYLDGEAFEGGSNAESENPHALVIGSGSFIDGFEDGLIGVIPSETSKDAPYDLHLTFPETYSNNPDLAGKDVIFKVWVEYTIPCVTDQPIKLGDSAFIYYTGYLDGKAFDGGSNAENKKPHELSIGSGSFIDGFEDGLIGVIPSETSKDAPYELHLTFPEDYDSEELAGKAVVFKVWIEYTVPYTIPSLTDDFVKNTLKFDGDAEEYRAYTKENLQAELTAAAEEAALDAVYSKLMENSTVIEYPQQSLDYYYQSYIDYYEDYRQYYAMYGYQFDTLEEFLVSAFGFDKDTWQDEIKELAKNSVQSSLILYHISKSENITVTDEEFDEYVEILIEESSSDTQTYTADQIISMYGKQQITEYLLSDKVNEFLLDNCTIEYKD